jgi:hypothetical protein
MEMKTLQLLYDKETNKSLVILLRDDETISEYVVCSNYNAKAKEYQWWSNGRYYPNIAMAMIDWNVNVLGQIPYDRLVELATKFKDGLLEDDEQSAYEYFDDECEMSDEEKDFFGIEIENEDI